MIVLDAMVGFDLGCFTWRYRRFGPILFYREMLSFEGDPPPLSGWKVAVILTKRAWDEFYEGLCK